MLLFNKKKLTVLEYSCLAIFAIFSPHESALCADDGSVAYSIFRFVKGRCNGNQIMLGEMRK